MKTGRTAAELMGHEGWVWAITFTPDSNTLVSGSWDGTIKLWRQNL
jgi:WD40 repeat protein